MKNICRPIVLYNVHVPTKKFNYKWRYTAFGIYDGIDVRNNIWKENTRSFDVLMDKLLNETLILNGNFSKEIIFAIRNENNNEDENFWNDINYPFVFLVSLYMDGRAKNWTQFRYFIEESINNSVLKSSARAITYQTLDNSDILLVIKAKSYKVGTDIINLFHDKDNEFVYKYEKDKFEKIKLHYSYSICGFDKNVELDEVTKNEVIEEVLYFAFEKKPGSIQPLVEKINKNLENTNAIITQSELLGSNDERITIKNIKWGEFMNLFSGNETSILTNENGLFCDSICYGSTQLNHKKEISYIKKIFIASDNGDDSEPLITNKDLCLNTEKIKQLKKHENITLFSNNLQELEYIKAISHIENAMHKFNDSDFPSYVYTAILEPMQLFLDQLVDFKAGKLKNMEYCEDNGIFNFLNAISIVIQSTSRMNRDFLQTPDFNVVINDVPIKLFAFYAAWAYRITQILNKSIENTDDKNQYSVLICPGLEKMVEIDMIFPKLPPKSRLLLVKAPERALYRPELLCNVLVHEISHYVGDKLRRRDIRYAMILEIYADIIVSKFKKCFDGLITPKMLQEIQNKVPNLVKQRARYYVTRNKKQYPEYSEYQYHTDFLKKISDDIIDTLIKEDFNLLYDHIRTDCLYEKIKLSKQSEETIYSEDFVEGILNGYNNAQIVEEKIKAFTDYFEKNSRSIIDNINNIAKEIFADLVCVLLLGTPGEVYLKNIYSNLNELSEVGAKISIEDNIVSVRVALMIRCMQTREAIKESGIFKFTYFWDEKLLSRTVDKNSSNMDFCQWIYSISNIMYAVENTHDHIENNNYLLNNYIWKCLLRYLYECRLEFEEWQKSNDDLKNQISDLREVYSDVSDVKNLEETLIKIRKFIENHKSDLKSDFSKLKR